MPSKKRIERVCILTGGGDAPGLNPVLRAFTKQATALGLEVFGSEDGFEGLIDGRVHRLRPEDVRGILPRGGSILGCSNRGDPFAFPIETESGAIELQDRSADVMERLKEHGIDALVLVGGDGTMAIGLRLQERGVPVVGVPKTIDNDLDTTDFTFGLDTAVGNATWAIDNLHATAESHDRVMILELMGRNAGWITLCAGIAGGADVILIPEIPYDIARVAAKIRERSEAGTTFSIVVIGEGACPVGEEVSTTETKLGRAPRLAGAGNRLKELLEKHVDMDIRVTVLGHLQRGGTPSAFDRLLGTRFGVRAAQLCAEGRTGRLVVLRGTKLRSVPLAEACAKPKLVPPDGELARAARAVDIELGAP